MKSQNNVEKEILRLALGEVQLAEARGSAATDENIARWTMHCVPLKRREDWEQLRDGLALAGMPVSDLQHNAW